MTVFGEMSAVLIMRVTDWARSKVDCINSKSVLINRMSD